MIPSELPETAISLAAFLALVAAMTFLAIWRHRDSRVLSEVRENVSNDHPEPLRDELDSRHAEIVAAFEMLGAGLSEVRTAVAKLDERTSRIGEEVDTNNAIRRREDARIRRRMAQFEERAEAVIAKHHPEDAS